MDKELIKRLDGLRRYAATNYASSVTAEHQRTITDAIAALTAQERPRLPPGWTVEARKNGVALFGPLHACKNYILFNNSPDKFEAVMAEVFSAFLEPTAEKESEWKPVGPGLGSWFCPTCEQEIVGALSKHVCPTPQPAPENETLDGPRTSWAVQRNGVQFDDDIRNMGFTPEMICALTFIVDEIAELDRRLGGKS
jgi:hypothetical protein